MSSTQQMSRTVLAAFLVLGIAVQGMPAQGKGKGQERKEARGNEGRGNQGRGDPGRGSQGNLARPEQDRGSVARSRDDGNPGRGKAARPDQRITRRIEHEFAGDVTRRRGIGLGRFRRDVKVSELRPSLRRFLDDDGPSRRVAAGALARAHLRGVDDDVLVLRPVDNGVHILNREGIVLVDLDRERARNLGWWDVVPIDDDAREGSPAFCRSGEGHPVFGRQWCLDKGFGLGGEDVRWARTRRLDDVAFLRPVTAGDLTRDALLSLLGPVVLDRLGLHAVTLGYTEPLTGRWLGSTDPSSGRVLLLTSGGRPVAEIVDTTRDDRADLMLVALRDW